MKKLALLLTVFFVASISTLQSQTINESKSKVKFHITGGGFFKVKGTFTGMKGDFNFDASALKDANFNICIDASTVNTKNKKRDAHLKDPDFFDVVQYPNICFKSSSVSKTNEGYIVKGKLTILEVTKDVEIPFTFNNKTFTGSLIVNRFDYNLGKDFGTFRVGKEATITIICEVN
ncbi:YceI family protein [Psychroserpens sp. S379A]|uniref:YceI family protein n=1 Tax=Psychroserpens sp. S379A TaxID=3415137 RepID=UPI003C7C40C3